MSIPHDVLTEVAGDLAHFMAERTVDIIFIGNWALNETFKPPTLIPLRLTGIDVVASGIKKPDLKTRIGQGPGKIRYNKHRPKHGSKGKLVLEWKSDPYTIPIDVHFGNSYFPPR